MKLPWMLLITLTTTKKMKMNEINNLKQLRAAKRELKLKMARQDREAQESFLYSTINKFFSKIEESGTAQNTPVGNGVHSALNFISNQAQNRLNMGKTTRTLLSLGVMIAAPIIAKKVQEFIDRKL